MVPCAGCPSLVRRVESNTPTRIRSAGKFACDSLSQRSPDASAGKTSSSCITHGMRFQRTSRGENVIPLRLVCSPCDTHVVLIPPHAETNKVCCEVILDRRVSSEKISPWLNGFMERMVRGHAGWP